MPSIIERVDAIFSEWDKPTSPGCALAIIQDGAIIYKHGYGMADLERGVHITSESLFDIGSTGKQFTATIIAILANQGYLSLGDSIRKYLPSMPVYADAITIRHLIHHTSGLRDYITLMELAGLPDENLYPEEALLDLILRQQELNFPPGEEYLYSNSGYFLLGIIAQRVTGRHLTELILEHIFTPLGMRCSTFNKDYRPIVPNRALSYEASENGSFTNKLSLCGGFGDGPIYSNVEDLLLWDQNFYHNKLNNAQPDLLEMLHTQGRLNNGETIEYTFGLSIGEYRGLKAVSHGGAWAGYRSELLRFPEQRFSVICLCNLASMTPEELARRVADVYFEAEFEGKPIPSYEEEKSKAIAKTLPITAEQARQYTGIYTSMELATEYVLSAQDDRLFLQRNRFTPRESLQATAPHTFKGKEIELSFTDQALSVASDRVKNIRFDKS
ncbi:MAG: beta-lactamase family protein [Anaerolineales bacterium]|nr:beta-lactamase family protein [Anaerolineales bacterium]